MTTAIELGINRTWNGLTIGSEERACITLRPRRDGLGITADAPFHGDPAPPAEPGPCARLWSHEVVELFIVGGCLPETPDEENPRQPCYTELELSPHGHYLLLRLRGVRRIVEEQLPISYRAQIVGRRWRGEALLPWHLLPTPPHRVNAFAIHGTASSRRYLARTPVPGREPDFHRLEYFEPLELGIEWGERITRSRR
ncbi:MAG: hypothetical protein AAF560_28090 [Acidobacteriota bacterium]